MDKLKYKKILGGGNAISLLTIGSALGPRALQNPKMVALVRSNKVTGSKEKITSLTLNTKL